MRANEMKREVINRYVNQFQFKQSTYVAHLDEMR